MTDGVFDIGSLAVLTHTVTVAGDVADPSTIGVDIKSPTDIETGDEPSTHAEWAGGAGQVERLSEGVYRFAFTPTAAGRWWYRWSTTGMAQEAREGTFWVKRSYFV